MAGLVIFGVVLSLSVGLITFFLERWFGADAEPELEKGNDGTEVVKEKHSTKKAKVTLGILLGLIGWWLAGFLYMEGFSFLTSSAAGAGVAYLLYKDGVTNLSKYHKRLCCGVIITPVWFEISSHIGIPVITTLFLIFSGWLTLIIVPKLNE